MAVVDLAGIGSTDSVGGKAAGLAALIRAGERVPSGFCVTTSAYLAGRVPEAEVLDAYAALGGGLVAVRSSATAEDLPSDSFAGQQDSFLAVEGADAVLSAITGCWDSLHSARAVAYRGARAIDDDGLAMAVVVQRWIPASVSGVLFTANPMTGSRREMMIEAAPGPGSGVVDGSVIADRYVLGDLPQSVEGCLTVGMLAELQAVGQRVQRLMGGPQDIEWAFDADGTLWLLQSRAITTLFPLPPDLGRPGPRVYVEFGHVQGMRQPTTPMGMASLQSMIAAIFATFAFKVEVVDIGGRLYGDLTDLVRHSATRDKVVKLMSVDFGPRAQDAVSHVLDHPDFSPLPGRPPKAERNVGESLGTMRRALVGVTRSLLSPESARRRAFAAVDQMRRSAAGIPAEATAVERLDDVESHESPATTDDLVWPIVAGMLASAAPKALLKGVVSEAEINAALAGMPHNVTIEMDLALWRLASSVDAPLRETLLDTSPAELSAQYLAGDLPNFGLDQFLADYGHRAAAEVDVGVPRWGEDPTPVFASIANYLRVTDPGQSPELRFERAAQQAERSLAEISARVAWRYPVRGRTAMFLLHRARELSGVREAGKFSGLYSIRRNRQQLLLVGAELRDRGLLDRPDDIFFLDLAQARAAVAEAVDHRPLVAARRAVHDRELRRRHVPVALLSDGTDVEATMQAQSPSGAGLVGVAASPGTATGPARVILSAAEARIEPGEILVAPTTDPGWTPLFLTAAGLVTETGAVMAHGPTVAREYGIPAVICVHRATERITTGQVITVDGARGTVQASAGHELAQNGHMWSSRASL